jgi:hypothetical protein
MESREETLAHSRRHVIRAKQLVREQRARVDELRDDGHDTSEAEKLLATLEATLHSMQQHLEIEEKLLGRKEPGDSRQTGDEARKPG